MQVCEWNTLSWCVTSELTLKFALKVLTSHTGALYSNAENLQAVIIFSYLLKSCSWTKKSPYAPEVGSCGPEVFVVIATIQVSLHQTWLWAPDRMCRSPVPFGSWLWQTTLCCLQEAVWEKGCGDKVHFFILLCITFKLKNSASDKHFSCVPISGAQSCSALFCFLFKLHPLPCLVFCFFLILDVS